MRDPLARAVADRAALMVQPLFAGKAGALVAEGGLEQLRARGVGAGRIEQC